MVENKIDPQRIPLHLRLRDNDGWPPLERESVMGIPRGGGLYVVDNPPFFALDLSVGDVVDTTTDDEGNVWAEALIGRSGHWTLRLFTSDAQILAAVEAELAARGCTFETLELRVQVLVAVDVPAEADIAEIVALLESRTLDGVFEWDSGWTEAIFDEDLAGQVGAPW